MLLAGAIVVDLIAKRILVSAVRAIAKRSAATWDDALVSNNVFGRLVQFVPALIVFIGVPIIPGMPESGAQLIRNVAMGYIALTLTMAMTSLLSAANSIYERSPLAKDRPLKCFVQLVQIAVWILGGIIVVATVLVRSPLLLLSGFGAMTAILLIDGVVLSIDVTGHQLLESLATRGAAAPHTPDEFSRTT